MHARRTCPGRAERNGQVARPGSLRRARVERGLRVGYLVAADLIETLVLRPGRQHYRKVISCLLRNELTLIDDLGGP